MSELPDDLKRLEEELTGSSPKPSPELRSRVLAEVEQELAVDVRTSPPSRQRSQSRWAFAAALAVSVLVWMNLSLTATTTSGPVQVATTCDIDHVADEILDLLPDLPPEEARRQAILLTTRETLILRPKLPASLPQGLTFLK